MWLNLPSFSQESQLHERTLSKTYFKVIMYIKNCIIESKKSDHIKRTEINWAKICAPENVTKMATTEEAEQLFDFFIFEFSCVIQVHRSLQLCGHQLSFYL